MDLYDDIDTKPKASQIDGWSSSIKMLQTQLAVKKAQVLHETVKKALVNPVANPKVKKSTNSEQVDSNTCEMKSLSKMQTLISPLPIVKNDDWDFVDEYDPLWPNEYEKLKDKQQCAKNAAASIGEKKRVRGRNTNSSPTLKLSGFAQPVNDEDRYSPPSMGTVSGKGGVAIAPPPSLQEISIANDNGDSSSNVTIPYTASSVAAKIMAKYGFRDGQGLGKQEQGMSVALQVEKTSKRGGRIIHERDTFIPPPPVVTSNITSINPSQTNMAPPSTPTLTTLSITINNTAPTISSTCEPSITEIMKEPSKVVLLRNMVGPGDVDEELEPEVKDECNTKYGEVNSVLIHEIFGTSPEDAVKIFVEFKRIESAIKAVVDLNGRFFGGRQVRAGFYNYDKFKNFQLS